MTPVAYVALALGALVIQAETGAAAVPSKAQEHCITALNRASARLAKATGNNFLRCLKDAGGGKLSPGQTCEQCLTADPDGTISRGVAYVTAAGARSCTVVPEFGPKTAADVNAAFTSPHGVPEVFGANLDTALIDEATDAAGAACQQAVAAGMVRIASAKIKAFNACKTAGLKRHTIPSAKALRECFDVDTGRRVAAAITRAQAAANATCTSTTVAAAFPGECAGESLGTLFECVAPPVECSVCLAIDAADQVGKGCHRFADGVATRYCGVRPATTQSVARQWDEDILSAIRIDTPRPTVHARNLFHLAAVMWDAWRAYGGGGSAFLTDESHASADPEADRATAISFAAYRLLSHRYALSANPAASQASFDARMAALGFDKTYTATVGDNPAAVGNRIAAAMIAFGQSDGANEQGNYADPTYVPVNDPLVVKLPGTTMNDPNRWQPLALDVIVTQNDIVLPGKIQGGIGMRWNGVTPFALTRSNPTDVYIDPGPPPLLGTATDADFKQAAVFVIQRSSELTPDDGATIDISPGAYGNNPLGTNDGTGHPLNPATGQPYDPQVVKRGDFARVLAEFWADGPASETPPGHWNTLANYLSDHPLLGPKQIGGTGPVVSDLEWDVKLYFALNGAVHDAAVVAWGLKRKYDSVRPISMIRYMGGLGQSSDLGGPAYDPEGLPLVPGLIEVITSATTAPGQRHELLAGHEGEIAIFAWPATPGSTYAGARWIRAVEWVPYQKPTFVTPAFPGFTSGHSTFSRAAAEILTNFTGSAYFPGGLGQFVAPANTYLGVEKGPTTSVALQWATYYDAADQAGQSRIYGGIHIQADDFNGRITGAQIGIGAYDKAQQYFSGTVGP
jgi:hypothetical protein